MTNDALLNADRLKANFRRVLKQRYKAQDAAKLTGMHIKPSRDLDKKTRKNRNQQASAKYRSNLKANPISKGELATLCLSITRRHV